VVVRLFARATLLLLILNIGIKEDDDDDEHDLVAQHSSTTLVQVARDSRIVADTDQSFHTSNISCR
jgi:hypothetical protein